jgi:hypothetical protein
MIDLSKYPRVQRFLAEHPEMNFQQAYEVIKKEYEKLESREGNYVRKSQ